MQEYTGTCLYCGQVQFIKAGDGLTEQEVNKLAIMQCNCDEAQALQKCEQKKTYADANIKRLFEGESQCIQELLIGHTEALSRQIIKKVTVTTSEGIRGTLTAKENSIKVERTEVKKSSLED